MNQPKMNIHKVWDAHIISEPKIELITDQINLVNIINSIDIIN